MAAAVQLEKTCEKTTELLDAYNRMKEVILMDTLRITESLLDATGMSDLERTLWNTDYPKESAEMIPGENARQAAEDAKKDRKKSEELLEQFNRQTEQNREISMVVMRYFQMLTRLDMRMVMMNDELRKVIDARGTSFTEYASGDISLFRRAAALSGKIRAIMQDHILNENGTLFAKAKEQAEEFLKDREL